VVVFVVVVVVVRVRGIAESVITESVCVRVKHLPPGPHTPHTPIASRSPTSQCVRSRWRWRRRSPPSLSTTACWGGRCGVGGWSGGGGCCQGEWWGNVGYADTCAIDTIQPHPTPNAHRPTHRRRSGSPLRCCHWSGGWRAATCPCQKR